MVAKGTTIIRITRELKERIDRVKGSQTYSEFLGKFSIEDVDIENLTLRKLNEFSERLEKVENVLNRFFDESGENNQSGN